MTEEVAIVEEPKKPANPVAFGIRGFSQLYQGNKEAPLYLVEDRETGEQFALCWDKEQAAKVAAAFERGCVVATDTMAVFTLQLLLLSTIRKLTETLIEDHAAQMSDEPLFISK